MTTTVDLDELLIQDAMRMTGVLSERETIEEALRLMIRIKSQEKLLAMQGKVEFWPDYDYKAMRKSRISDLDETC